MQMSSNDFEVYPELMDSSFMERYLQNLKNIKIERPSKEFQKWMRYNDRRNSWY